MCRKSFFALLVVSFAATGMAARSRLEDYALILDGPAAAEQAGSAKELRSAAAQDRLKTIRSAQQRLRRELQRRKIPVTGSVEVLLNAVFVRVPAERADELRALPGVQSVQWMRRMKRHLDQAVNLMNVPAAWNGAGGVENAGAGVKIGILDTGIDQSHKAFQDSSLAVPDGYPKGEGAFTNSKVIVARSYVASLALGNGTPEDTRPDDLSPRDRSGHGTAVAMIAAGGRNTGPVGAITGIAPKAWLGNYKVFGTPGVNDFVSEKVIMQALEDAVNDGMDMVVLPVGGAPICPVLSSDCGALYDQPKFAIEQAVRNAIGRGLTIVVSAGNDGDTGQGLPSLNTIQTPGILPEAITVGAVTNSHNLVATVRVAGEDAPVNLKAIDAIFGDGPRPPAAVTGALRDVANFDDDGEACRELSAGSLTGAIALIQRGNCDYSIKINNAQGAGAVGAVIYQLAGGDSPVPMTGLGNTAIAAVMIGHVNGRALKLLVEDNSDIDTNVTLDPVLRTLDGLSGTVASFSSRGPAIGTVVGAATLKPDVAAVGTNIYTATQNSDPNGDLFDSSGYREVSGTSFAAAMAGGTAALVKQRHPSFSPPQIKSALVNTATADVTDVLGAARVTEVGGGKLDAGAAVEAGATLEPATLSFGIPQVLPVALVLRLTNNGKDAATFRFSVTQRDADANAAVTVSPASVTLNAGQTTSVSVQLNGRRPAPGSYEGFVTVSGGGSTNLKVPYLYLVGNGVPFNIFPVEGASFTGVVKDHDWPLFFRLVDRFGVPAENVPVQFNVVTGGGRVTQADPVTRRGGVAGALVDLGAQAGDQIFTATAGGLSVEFDGYARASAPVIASLVNAATGQLGQGLAAGSHATIRGSLLSDASKTLNSRSLPIQMAGVSVSFDAPGVSVPGRLISVSPRRIDLQIPWEVRGSSPVQVKVSLGLISSALYTLPLADYSPGIFGVTDAAGAPITADNRARRGQPIVISANGLGPVDNQPASGEPAAAEPLSATRVTPVVTIGGKQAEISFSGLEPSSAGKYQIKLVVPADADAGTQQLVITVGGVSSNTVMIPVQ